MPLLTEIETVAGKLDAVHDVGHMHWGGGSPNVLTPPDIKSLTGVIKQHFRMAPGAEFAAFMAKNDTAMGATMKAAGLAK